MNDRRRSISRRVGVSLLLICSFLMAQRAFAQEAASAPPRSRAELLRQAREEKQKRLTPNTPDAVQRAMTQVEQRAAQFGKVEGPQPWVGTVGRGSGLAFGALFRDRDLFNRYGTLETWAGYSIREYWAAEMRAFFPALADGRVTLEATAGIREDPKQDFFGVGPDASREDRTSFLLRTIDAGATAGVRLAPLLTVGGGLKWIQPRLARGHHERFASTEQRFSPAEAPGLDVETDFTATSAFLEFDYREPKNARKGGWYRLDVTRYDDTNGNRLGFTRADIDLRQYIGFLAGRRVIALRSLVSTTDAGDLQDVPFYLMPSLGGSRTLRGYRRFRFRGPHAMLLQAEYRWEIWSAFEGAIFYDAGKVAMDRSALSLRDLESNFGFGLRFNTNNGVVLRFDTGFGREGAKFRMAVGGPF